MTKTMEKMKTYPSAIIRDRPIAGQEDVIEIFSDSLINVEPLTIAIIGGGSFVGKAYFLENEYYHWVIARDERGFLMLIPIKRENK